MKEQDYIRDIAEIRSMMERSSKFLSLYGGAGILAGIYALAGAYIAVYIFNFNPDQISYETNSSGSIVLLGLTVLALALGSAIYLSFRKAQKRGEKIWNTVSKRLMVHMAAPLVAGGFLILILMFKNLVGLVAPISLLFYGIALFNAGIFTYKEVKALGLFQILLGLLGCYFVEYGLFLWALGFGILHIFYGIYLYYKYER